MSNNFERHTIRVFVSYVHEDRRSVEKICQQLSLYGADIWIDYANLLPGQKWEEEIIKAMDSSDAILLCLSNFSSFKEGHYQKEISFVLEKAKEKPEGKIYIIPVRLEDCKVQEKLLAYHHVDLFLQNSEGINPAGYIALVNALNGVAKDRNAWFKRRPDDGNKQFGYIVKSLRTDLKITTEQLAQKANLDFDLLSGVENGVPTLLKVSELNSLCYALELTNLEKREFLSAANGLVDNELLYSSTKIPLPSTNLDSILLDAKRLIQQIRIPAFITDVYSDVLLANVLVMDLLEMKEKFISNGINEIDGFNLMRVLFHPDASYPTLVGENWDLHALLNVRFFRRMSLRYRANKYFADLMKKLTNYPEFIRYYEKAIETPYDEFYSYAIYSLEKKNYGRVTYTGTEIFFANTQYGELYLHIYLPLDKTTENLFLDLFQKYGETCIPFAAFPDPRKAIWSNNQYAAY